MKSNYFCEKNSIYFEERIKLTVLWKWKYFIKSRIVKVRNISLYLQLNFKIREFVFCHEFSILVKTITYSFTLTTFFKLWIFLRPLKLRVKHPNHEKIVGNWNYKWHSLVYSSHPISYFPLNNPQNHDLPRFNWDLKQKFVKLMLKV